jgi:hypothetical protein
MAGRKALDRRLRPRHLKVAVVLSWALVGIAGAIAFALAHDHQVHLAGIEELRADARHP